MATLGDALLTTLSDSWGAGGGAEPTFHNTEDIKLLPTIIDATGHVIFMGYTQKSKFDRKTADHVRKEHRVRLAVYTADGTDKEERLDEVLNELERIMGVSTPTGYDGVEVEDVDRSLSDKSRDIYAAYMDVMLVEVLADSAITPGAVATSTITVDELTVNTAIIGSTTITGTVYSSTAVPAFTGTGTAGSVNLFAGSPTAGAFITCFGDTHATSPGILRYTSSSEGAANGEHIWRHYTGEAWIEIAELDKDGNFQIDGDLTISGASPSITGTNIADLLMFGAANAAWVPCAFELGTAVGKVEVAASAFISNVDGTNMNLRYLVPLPTNKGSLKLYITKVKAEIHDADVDDFITSLYLWGQDNTGLTDLYHDFTNIDSAQAKTWTLGAAVDCSSYASCFVFVYLDLTDANDFDLADVSVECYYAA